MIQLTYSIGGDEPHSYPDYEKDFDNEQLMWDWIRIQNQHPWMYIIVRKYQIFNTAFDV